MPSEYVAPGKVHLAAAVKALADREVVVGDSGILQTAKPPTESCGVPIILTDSLPQTEACTI